MQRITTKHLSEMARSEMIDHLSRREEMLVTHRQESTECFQKKGHIKD